MRTPLTVCSFYVDRREDYPDAVDYIPLLLALNYSCHRLGFEHIVLSDRYTMELPKVRPMIKGSCFGYSADGGLVIGPRGGPLQFTTSDLLEAWPDLPRSLARATTESQARHLEMRAKWNPMPSDLLFVGADCLVRRDFRGHIPGGDLVIAFRPENKRHRLQNGFMYIPAASVKKVAPLFRRVADTCGEAMCDDLKAIKRALSPMPADYGLHERAGLAVNFVPMMPWQGVPDAPEDPIEDAYVLHFRGQRRKQLMLDWAKRHLIGEP